MIPTIELSREQKINAIHIAIILVIDDANAIRYALVQDALHKNMNEPSPTIERMREAVKTLFPDARQFEDVKTFDVEALFSMVPRDVEQANHLNRRHPLNMSMPKNIAPSTLAPKDRR